ncbi:hypothetical protein EVA_06507 [gut metagenome]|uniref:Uncharacterized protein n=1 Tax=gut metagenome TaxID=749906 RepID=J9CYP0_9ZZZZ
MRFFKPDFLPGIPQKSHMINADRRDDRRIGIHGIDGIEPSA